MKHIFILNAYGKRDPKNIINEIFKYCVNNNMDYEIVLNKGELTENIVKRYAKKDTVIYAVGGDGMINRVLNGIVNTDAYLGYLPYGTGNDLDRFLATYDDGVMDVNLGKINDKYFINIACFGVDADIANNDKIVHDESIKREDRYNKGILPAFLNYKPRELSVDYRFKDNKLYPLFSGVHMAYRDFFSTIVICNGQYYGGGYKVGPNADIQDGLFDTYFVDRLGYIRLLFALAAIKKGNHEEKSYVTKHLLDGITIRSREPFKANIDGEALESDEFIVTMDNNIKVYNNQEMINSLAEPLDLKRVLKK